MQQRILYVLIFALFPALMNAQRTGINTSNPLETLDVNGNIKTDTLKAVVLKMSTGAGLNKVLRSDANGVASWATLPAASGGGSLDTAYNFGGNGSGRFINAVSGPVTIQGTDGIMVTGTNTSGLDLSTSGNGTRMFFYPKRSAFRAGYVSGNYWNRDSIGNFSSAIGQDSRATNTASFAWGNNTQASGVFSTAGGGSTHASGSYATALGYFSQARGATALASGNYSAANGYYATALGTYTVANGNGSLVIGAYNDSVLAAPATFSFPSTNPLFIIGNGSSPSARSNAMVVNYNGHVGIGTNNPASRLEVNANTGPVMINGTDGLLVTGTYGSGVDLNITGAGTRMFFYPKKAAFRAGYVTAGQWNKDSIGNYSFAVGYNAKATGAYSAAIGLSVVASGDQALALGYNATASGIASVAAGFGSKSSASNSMALGTYCEANSGYSFAIGYNSISSGTQSGSIGFYTNATATNAFAFGSNTTASGNNSVAGGFNSSATASYSVALGNNAIASGDNATALGSFNTASGSGSFTAGDDNAATGTLTAVIGEGLLGVAQNSITLGRYNDSLTGSSRNSWVATDPLFLIGNGSSNASRSNAFVVYKNGNGEINGSFIPTTGGVYTLGKNNKKWLEVWATNGVIQTSDSRFKKQITNSEYGLNTLMQMRPVTYYWKEGTTTRQLGFIAQEMQQLVPEAVTDPGNGESLGMNYSTLIPVLTRAIQEQQEQIRTLKARLEQLEQRQ